MTMNKQLIKDLREATYASYIDCAKALTAQEGDYDAALAQLRAASLDKADRKAERETHDGLVIVKQAGDVVCAVQLDCETDFVALTYEFKALVHQIAKQVLADAALSDVGSVLAASLDGMPDQTIALTIAALIGKLGENIKLSHVARYEARPGSIAAGYVHAGAIDGYGPQEGRLGVLVELAVGDASAVNNPDDLAMLARHMTLHIASGSPTYLSRSDIPAEVLAEQQATLAAQVANMDKPTAIKDKIVAGRLDKFYQEVCLLDQPYILDEELTVDALLQQTSESQGTPVGVARFERCTVNT